MNKALKLIVGIATVTGLMGSQIGVAQAVVNTVSIGAASTAFIGLNPVLDVQWIDHLTTPGRPVTNDDTTAAHNAVASLGVVAGSAAAFTVNVRASNASTGAMVCFIILNDVTNGSEAILSQTWNSGDIGPGGIGIIKTFHFGATGNPLTATAFCNIPINVGGGAKVFAVWTS
jgi:hypothetical protein